MTCSKQLLKGLLKSLARWGGDEFTILFTKLSGRDALLDAPQEALKPTFILKNHYLQITTSIGISLYPQAGMNVDTLLKNADIALYRVKDSGRNTYIAIANHS